MPVDKVTIKIPRPLYEKIQEVIEGAGFNSPTDFIVYVLRDLVGEQKMAHSDESLTEKEIDAIRRRLRGLGYL
ncbi:MAG: ribbon-helix-helix domain-containing protein [bacterium]